jgi:hypothetical protein
MTPEAILFIVGVPALLCLGIGWLVHKSLKRIKVIVLGLIFLMGICTYMLVVSFNYGVLFFYWFDRYSICAEEQLGTSECDTYVTSEEQAWKTHLPIVILWQTMPDIFHPSCETISIWFCNKLGDGTRQSGGWEATLHGLFAVVFTALA